MPSIVNSARALLTLGRASNLPTVWSNCLAAQWAVGDVNPANSFRLLLAASLLYTSGMYLNDAFDQAFDRKFRPERPIPSGRVSPQVVWALGFLMMGCGLILLSPIGPLALALGALLSASIVLYDATHKHISFGPLIMAACRFILFLTAASTGPTGLTGRAVWLATALAAYIVGLSYIAKTENQPGLLRFWPCLLLSLPAVLALLLNDGPTLLPSMALLAVFVGWTLYALRLLFAKPYRNVPAAVSALLAGIVWVDLLSTAGTQPTLLLLLPAFFLLARAFQRWIPAT